MGGWQDFVRMVMGWWASGAPAIDAPIYVDELDFITIVADELNFVTTVIDSLEFGDVP